MGLFSKLKNALKKTKNSLAAKLNDLFGKNKLGDAFYEELEEILISSDVSVRTAEEIVEEIKERAELLADLMKLIWNGDMFQS